MYCIHCGKKLADEARFCDSCGADVSAQEQADAKPERKPTAGRAKRKALTAILIGLLACLMLFLTFFAVKGIAASFSKEDDDDGEKPKQSAASHDPPELLSGGGTAIRYEGKGFDTPEEAVLCYVNGLKNLDFEQMLSAFAWETQAEHFSVTAHLTRLTSYSPSYRPRMPSTHEFLIEANLHAVRAGQTDAIYRSLEAYLLGDAFTDGKIISLPSEEDVEEFLRNYDLGRLEMLSNMKNIRFVSPDSVTESKFSLEQNQKNLIAQTSWYCADEIVNLVALADVGDELLYVAPTVARYGDRWYLVSVGSLTSSIRGVDAFRQAFMVAPREELLGD